MGSRPILDRHARRAFRDGLKEARAEALKDAEGYAAVVRAMERIGSYPDRENYLETIAGLVPYCAKAMARKGLCAADEADG